MQKKNISVYKEDSDYLDTLKIHPNQCVAEVIQNLIKGHKLVNDYRNRVIVP